MPFDELFWRKANGEKLKIPGTCRAIMLREMQLSALRITLRDLLWHCR
jgi:hypothetical protein